MNLYKITVYLILFIIFPFSGFAVGNNNSKIMVVDIESILENSVAMQKIRKSINKISNIIQTEMSSKELELKKEEEQLIKQRGVLSTDEFEKKNSRF